VRAGLLPGRLCATWVEILAKPVHVRVEMPIPRSPTRAQGGGSQHPIGHMEGNYFCDGKALEELNRHNRVVFSLFDAIRRHYADWPTERFAGQHAGICSLALILWG